MFGEDPIGVIYSDNHPSLLSASEMLGVVPDTSQPNVHETNGMIERAILDIQEGARHDLCRAGLPAAFWPYAVNAYCHSANVSERKGFAMGKEAAAPGEPVKTSWFLRFGEDFPGQVVPLGAHCYFLPNPEGYVVEKAAPRLESGIFFGHRFNSGGKWSGEYLVVPLDAFVGQDLAVDAKVDSIMFLPHRTKVISHDPSRVVFPYRNGTRSSTRPWKGEVPV